MKNLIFLKITILLLPILISIILYSRMALADNYKIIILDSRAIHHPSSGYCNDQAESCSLTIPIILAGQLTTAEMHIRFVPGNVVLRFAKDEDNFLSWDGQNEFFVPVGKERPAVQTLKLYNTDASVERDTNASLFKPVIRMQGGLVAEIKVMIERQTVPLSIRKVPHVSL